MPKTHISFRASQQALKDLDFLVEKWGMKKTEALERCITLGVGSVAQPKPESEPVHAGNSVENSVASDLMPLKQAHSKRIAVAVEDAVE